MRSERKINLPLLQLMVKLANMELYWPVYEGVSIDGKIILHFSLSGRWNKKPLDVIKRTNNERDHV